MPLNDLKKTTNLLQKLQTIPNKKLLLLQKYNYLRLKKFYNCKHAIVVNSWTSGLIASVGALDVNPGDEIIVSPWTMSATATAILHWNAIPVFADIDYNTHNIDPKSVEKLITKKN